MKPPYENFLLTPLHVTTIRHAEFRKYEKPGPK